MSEPTEDVQVEGTEPQASAVESALPDEIVAHALVLEDKLTALVQGYNFETGEFVR